MRIPEALAPLFDYGIVEEVVRPLMSGKEAQVYIVVSGGKHCVAKVYKDAQSRSFKQRAEYTEGRKVRNTRDQRAMGKRSKHGRAQDEAAWKSTEVDMIHRLHAAGVRVPTPLHFVEGVLLMELVLDADGDPAPRVADLAFDPESAEVMYGRLMREVVRMVAAGVVHGDLSDFNVLVGADGPVIIDFPQSVDIAQNANARKLLLRDVDNLHRFWRQYAPSAPHLPYAEEMWDLFQQNALTPDSRLTGRWRPSERRANVHSVLDAIQDANFDEQKRREKLGIRGAPPVEATHDAPQGPPTREPPAQTRPAEHRAPRPQQPHQGAPRPQQPYQGAPRPQQPHQGAPRPQQPHQGAPRPQQPHQGAPRPQQPYQGQPRHDGPHPQAHAGRPAGGGPPVERSRVFDDRRPAPPAPTAPTATQGPTPPRVNTRSNPRDRVPVDVIVSRRPRGVR